MQAIDPHQTALAEQPNSLAVRQFHIGGWPGTRIRVGLDALAVERFGRTRLVQLGTLCDVFTAQRGARLDLVLSRRAAKSMTVRVGRAARPAAFALCELLRSRCSESTPIPPELEPSNEPVTARAARLIALRSRDAGYRSTNAAPEIYWQVLGAAGAPSPVRIAAAAALGSRTAAHAARARTITDALVDPGLRTAVELAGSTNDPAHLAALLSAFTSDAYTADEARWELTGGFRSRVARHRRGWTLVCVLLGLLTIWAAVNRPLCRSLDALILCAFLAVRWPWLRHRILRSWARVRTLRALRFTLR